MATVVTAFYEINSKFDSKMYWSWFRNFAAIKCNLVVYTSPDLVNKVLEMRREKGNINKTIVYPIPFEQLYHYQYYKKYEQEYEKDYYKKHTPELYIIWAEKVKFVTKTVNTNPFNTDIFIWCDFGAFRKSYQTNFPNPNKIIKNKMNFLLLEDFIESDKIPVNGIKGQPYGTVRIGGGIQGGDAKTWQIYDQKWDEMLNRYFLADRFAGQDQCIIGSIYLENPELFHLIQPHEGYKDDVWFYLLWYWS